MKRSLLLVLPLLLLLLVLAAGCAPGASVQAALQATATPAHSFSEMGVPVNTPGPGEDVLPTPEMPVITDASRPDAECIACHQDAEQLQLVAEEEEVQESLNEGSG